MSYVNPDFAAATPPLFTEGGPAYERMAYGDTVLAIFDELSSAL